MGRLITAAAFLLALAFPVCGGEAKNCSWTNDFRRILCVPAGNGSNCFKSVSLLDPASGYTVLFPEGKPKALTLSYDDDTAFNRQFVAVINKYKLKATFNLNSGYLGGAGIQPQEVKTLFAGHEVASHTTDHTGMWNASDDLAVRLLMPDRIALEELVGYPIRGMAYPSGSVKPNARELFPKLGIVYGRGIQDDGTFALDKDVFDWRPTTHHDDMIRYAKEFLVTTNSPALLYVWGHAYEFDRDKKWELLDEFCNLASGKADIWYATNIQIVDYLEAIKRLIFMADGSAVQNPSAISVWVQAYGRVTELKPGKLTPLK